MTPILLIIGLFLYLAFVGQGVISLLKPRIGVLASWFIAPTVGLSLLLAIMTRINVNGVPVRNFAGWLTIGLFVFAAAVLIWRRPKLPYKQLAPFFFLICGYVIYTGWPLLRFGYHWISYGNDDMANYCLAASRFLDHGYYDIPLQTQLEGTDYAQHYWFMHALQQIRPGSELAIAWVAALTNLLPYQVFMPTILVLSMLQISALGAIAVFKGRYRRVALLAFLCFGMSPLFGLGTLYQLIAQVGGIALLLTISCVLLSTRALNWRKLVLGGLLTCCLGILYPEVSPFVALTILIYAARLRYTNGEKLKPYAWFIVGVAVLTFLFLATNTYEFINTLVMQSVGSAGLGAMAEINDQSGGLVLFPWTLVPSFLPMLVGLHPFGVVGTNPWISIQIAVGILVLIFVGIRMVRNFIEGSPAGYLAAVMVPLGFYLFFKGQDFGLFKLAMFAQPVIMLMLAQIFAWLMSRFSVTAGRAVMIIYLLCMMPSHIYYSYASIGMVGGGLTEVVQASKLGVKFTPPKNLKYGGIESDISNVVTAKMLAQYTQGIDTRFLSRSYMDNIANIAVLKFLRTPDPDLGPQARIIEKLALLRFLLPDELMTGDVPDYRVMTIQKLDNNWTETSSRHLSYPDRLFVSVRTDLDHFNKANPGTGWTVDHMYQYKLESQVKDRLIFIHSELSPHYYSSARFKAAFFQREPEPITFGEVYFHGTGRYTLFNIKNPSPNLRVIMDFTRTSLGENRSQLPQKAIVIGDEDYRLPFVGHGSARVVTDIIKPEYFDKEAFITIDLGEKPEPIWKEKTGLMAMYGRKFNLDDRRLVGFTRDISVITDEQYQEMRRPMRISKFPRDLYMNPGLEYSGLFEDGWVAEDSYIKLGPSKPGQLVVFRGYIPDVPKYRTEGIELTISINDRPTEIVNLKSGKFDLSRVITEASKVTTVTLHFSEAQVYDPRRDRRAVSAYVQELAVVDNPDTSSFARIANTKGHHIQIAGVDKDGWLTQNAALTMPVFENFKALEIDLEMPGWATIAENQVTVTLNGKSYTQITAPKGTYQTISLPLTAGVANEIKLDSAHVFPLTGEKRERSFLVKNISVAEIGKSDLFTHGWSPSGYTFNPGKIDSDGWVDGRTDMEFPATSLYKTALVEVARFPARASYDLHVDLDGKTETRSLASDQPEIIKVPLSATNSTKLSLSADEHFALTKPDTRSRSYRVINIGFQ